MAFFSSCPQNGEYVIIFEKHSVQKRAWIHMPGGGSLSVQTHGKELSMRGAVRETHLNESICLQCIIDPRAEVVVAAACNRGSSVLL